MQFRFSSRLSSDSTLLDSQRDPSKLRISGGRETHVVYDALVAVTCPRYKVMVIIRCC